MKTQPAFQFARLLMFAGALFMLSGPAATALLIERVGGEHATLQNLDPQPAAGGTITQPETGAVIRRISDVALTANPDSENPKSWDGVSTIGLTNGYSRFPCVDLSGKYALAFGVTPLACLYELDAPGGDPKFLGLVKSAKYKLGDQQELKWSRDPSRPFDVYYCLGRKYMRQNVLEGPASEQEIADWGAWFRHTSDGDASSDGRYVAMALENKTVRVLDMLGETTTGKQLGEPALLPGIIQYPNPSGCDMSPDGAWVKVDNRFYSMAGMKSGTITPPIKIGAGHGGWAIDHDGSCWFVYQNSQIDWVEAFNPTTQERRYLMRMPEVGGGNYGVGIHVASDKSGAAKGWALVSAYQTGGPFAHNAFFLELKSCKKPGLLHPSVGGKLEDFQQGDVDANERPRIVRAVNMQHQYYNGQYFTEGFASIDAKGRIYWGGNWRGTDNMELYQAVMPEDARKILMIAD